MTSLATESIGTWKILFSRHAKGMIAQSSYVCIACEFYGDDLDKLQLSAQLLLLVALINDTQSSHKNELTIHSIVEILCQLTSAQKCTLSQVFIVMKLLLVIKAMNACSERSFSALWRL